MNQVRITRKQEDLYRINICDDGTEIVFDLADIGLPFKCNKAFQEVEKNKQVAIGKIKALENQKNEKESGNLFGTVERQILNTYKEMFERNRQIMDDFFGCPGAMQKLFDDANYMDMYDDLFEQFEPHFEAMQLNTETIKERLKKKYQKKQNDVLS